MNRFFSKLDLRDIKIDPEGSRFPPDADEQDHAQEDVLDAPVEQPANITNGNGHHQEASAIDVGTWESPTFPANATNGHAPEPPASQAIQSDAGLLPAPTATTFDIDGVIVGADGEVLKVSARSRPSAVAGAIAGVVREAGRAEVQAIGAGATNQAVKAVAIARDYLRETGIDAVCLPAFIDVTIENEDRTAIRLVVEPR